MIIRRKSKYSGEVNEMDLDVTDEQIADWQGGTLIQHAMPNLSADEREFLISGMTPEEWKEMWG